MKRIIFIVSILLSFLTDIYSQGYLNHLNSKSEFNSFSGAPLANKYGNVKAIKIVYELKSQNLYYINANVYENHYKFCEKELRYVDGIGNFLKHNYSIGSKRKYLLANINYFQSINRFVLEISPTDLMTKKQIIEIYNLVRNSFFDSDNIYFITNSPRLQEIYESLNKDIKTISPFEIYGNLSYQSVSKYKNTGILKFVDNINSRRLKINANDILVLKSIPNYLPQVAGVIVTEFQTPLSHISILGLNRKIPICVYTKVFEDEDITKFDGQQVSFTVNADTFLIELDTTKLVQKQIRNIDLELNLSVNYLIDVENLNYSSASFVGSKAANFAELYHLSKSCDFKTPEGAFAIPFFFYQQHIIDSKTDKLISRLIESKFTNPQRTNRKLKRIRRKIEKAEINDSLLTAIENRIIANGDFKRFRFRSSTNAEDIEGFSGAGLYTSKTGKLNSKKNSIESAIKDVWASNWSEEAYREREYYNINQKNVAMGILVHRAFPKEKVNGVAITKNIYRRNSNGFLVNAQLGNENVVNPSPRVICDQFLCFPQKANKIYKDKIVIDVITYSNLNDNKLVMSKEEIQNLANQLEIIKRHYAGDIDPWSYTRIGYDIEFKIDGEDNQLYIKQVRPYND